jgi:hypothetical protein
LWEEIERMHIFPQLGVVQGEELAKKYAAASSAVLAGRGSAYANTFRALVLACVQGKLFQCIKNALRDCMFGFSQIFNLCSCKSTRYPFDVVFSAECNNEVPSDATSRYPDSILRFESRFSRFLESG